MALVKTCDNCDKEIRRAQDIFKPDGVTNYYRSFAAPAPLLQFIIRQPGCIGGMREFEFCSAECLLAAAQKHHNKDDEIIELE